MRESKSRSSSIRSSTRLAPPLTARRSFRLATIVSMLTALLAGCGNTSSTNDRSGDPDVYARIAALTDCDELQREFDTAMDNADARPARDPLGEIAESYGEAADGRMREIGCYG